MVFCCLFWSVPVVRRRPAPKRVVVLQAADAPAPSAPAAPDTGATETSKKSKTPKSKKTKAPSVQCTGTDEYSGAATVTCTGSEEYSGAGTGFTPEEYLRLKYVQEMTPEQIKNMTPEKVAQMKALMAPFFRLSPRIQGFQDRIASTLAPARRRVAEAVKAGLNGGNMQECIDVLADTLDKVNQEYLPEAVDFAGMMSAEEKQVWAEVIEQNFKNLMGLVALLTTAAKKADANAQIDARIETAARHFRETMISVLTPPTLLRTEPAQDSILSIPVRWDPKARVWVQAGPQFDDTNQTNQTY